jgi:hypothetical protein
MLTPEKDAELRKNYDVFMKLLPRFLPNREGQFALMRSGEIVEWFPSVGGAFWSGRARFADDLFSVQEARSAPVDFGWFSRAPFDAAV